MCKEKFSGFNVDGSLTVRQAQEISLNKLLQLKGKEELSC